VAFGAHAAEPFEWVRPDRVAELVCEARGGRRGILDRLALDGEAFFDVPMVALSPSLSSRRAGVSRQTKLFPDDPDGPAPK
jgi:hypothetical protein